MRNKNSLLILLLFFITSSCVDEYWPDLDKYENLLVVDGILTNSDDPLVVRLSISSSINSEKLIPVSEGEVFVSDESQLRIPLVETESGIYKATDSSFRGQIGKTYQLHVNLPNGQRYISDECLLKEPSPIDSVYGILESPDFSNNKHDFPGIQFYIENHSEHSDTSYYLWKLFQTWEYRSTFDIDYTWEGEFIPNLNPDSLRTCWRTTKVNDIIVSSTKFLDPTDINPFPLHFVSTETKMLSIKYSLLVRQFSISKQAYHFYNAIAEQNIDQGNLWSQQPVQILGNMHNVNNSDEAVLGFFIVGGVNQKRIFVDRPLLTFYYSECVPDFESVQYVTFSPPSTWPVYIDDIMFLGWAMAESRSCFDCQLDGGSLIPPDFWE